MAYQKYYGYEYETSPRKLQPEYIPSKRVSEPYKGKKASTLKQEPKAKANIKPKKQVILFIAVAFAILLGISYRNSLISEKFNEKEALKTQLGSIQKENEQLKVNIESSLNLNNVEQMANEMLGMKKLDNKQKVYISLPKKDYIESATEEVIVDENTSIWQGIWSSLTKNIK